MNPITCDEAYVSTSKIVELPPLPNGLIHQPTIREYPREITFPVNPKCGESAWGAIAPLLTQLDDILSALIYQISEQNPRIVYSPLINGPQFVDAKLIISELEKIINQTPSMCFGKILMYESAKQSAVRLFGQSLADAVGVMTRLPFPGYGYLGHYVPFLYLLAELSFVLPISGSDAASLWHKSPDLVMTLSQLDSGGVWRFGFARNSVADPPWVSYTAERPWVPLEVFKFRKPKRDDSMRHWLDRVTATAARMAGDTYPNEWFTDFLYEATMLVQENGANEFFVELVRDTICVPHAHGFIMEYWESVIAPVHVCAATRAHASVAFFCATELDFEQRVNYFLSFSISKRVRSVTSTRKEIGNEALETVVTNLGSLGIIAFHDGWHNELSPEIFLSVVDWVLWTKTSLSEAQSVNKVLLRGIGRVMAIALIYGIYDQEDIESWGEFFGFSNRIRRGFYDCFHENSLEQLFAVTELNQLANAMAEKIKQQNPFIGTYMEI